MSNFNKCEGCIYLQFKTRCAGCFRQYSDYPDCYCCDEDFYFTGKEVADLAERWPDNLYRDIFGIAAAGYFKRPAALEEIIEKILTLLDDHSQQVILLRYKEGKTHKEIAETLGVSIDRIGRMKERSLRMLRQPFNREKVAILGVSLSDLSASRHGRGDSRDGPSRPIGLYSEENSLKSLGLSYRAFSSLVRAKIRFVSDLQSMTKKELLEVPGIGEKNCSEVVLALGKRGLFLSPEPTASTEGSAEPNDTG